MLAFVLGVVGVPPFVFAVALGRDPVRAAAWGAILGMALIACMLVMMVSTNDDYRRADNCRKSAVEDAPGHPCAPGRHQRHTLSAIEREGSNPLSGTLAAIEAALVEEGIHFLPDGVRLQRR
jgi:hypothetical protein